MTEQTKEQEIAKTKERQREVALENLKSGLWDYALPRFVTPEQYGQLSRLAEGKYQEILSKTPSQDVYEKVFLPALSNESGAVTSSYIRNTSAAILQESLQSIKIEDIMQYLESDKKIKDELKSNYIIDIKDDKIKFSLISSYISKAVNEKVKGLIDESNKNSISELEKIVCDIPEAANNSDYTQNVKQAA